MYVLNQLQQGVEAYFTTESRCWGVKRGKSDEAVKRE
jgi:hypothetical protein